LDKFFNPRTVAVVGASTRPGKIGYEVLRTLASSGYSGGIYPVNPSAAGQMLLGRKCYARLADLPERAELAVLVVAAEKMPAAMEECAAAGVQRAVIISGGFKELGGEGETLERRTVQAARAARIRVIGPNCIGISSSSSRLETFFQPREMMERPGPGPVAILSQSGTYGATLLEWFAQEGLGVSKFASFGNHSDVDEVDLAGYLAGDPDTGIMVFYVEGLQRPREFFGLARRICPQKPILMLKGARTAAGARAAASHTGSIAGSFGSFAGAMAQCGVLLADDSEGLLDMAKLLCLQPCPAGGRIMMVTNGAGPCVIASDMISESRWLALARLGGPGADSLRKALPPFCVVGNPIDLTGSAESGHFLTALDVAASDPSVDILLPVFVFQDAPLGLSAGGLEEVVRKVMAGGKTMAAVAGGGSFTRLQAARLQKAGLPVFPSARRAVMALEGMVRHSLWKELHRLHPIIP
jgi:acyl-CoA synthetase (NDP forming)